MIKKLPISTFKEITITLTHVVITLTLCFVFLVNKQSFCSDFILLYQVCFRQVKKGTVFCRSGGAPHALHPFTWKTSQKRLVKFHCKILHHCTLANITVHVSAWTQHLDKHQCVRRTQNVRFLLQRLFHHCFKYSLITKFCKICYKIDKRSKCFFLQQGPVQTTQCLSIIGFLFSLGIWCVREKLGLIWLVNNKFYSFVIIN